MEVTTAWYQYQVTWVRCESRESEEILHTHKIQNKMEPTTPVDLTEQLHNACRIGDTNTVKILLDKGVNPYEGVEYAPSALHQACDRLGLIRGVSFKTHRLVQPSSRLAVVRMLLDHKSFKFDASSKRKGHERTVLEVALYWLVPNSRNDGYYRHYFREDSEDSTHHGFNVVMSLWTRGIGCRPGYIGIEDWFSMFSFPGRGSWLCCYGETRIHLYRCCKESIENYQPSLISLLAFQLCLMRVHKSSTVSASSSALIVFRRTWPPIVDHKIKEFLIPIPPMHVQKVMKQVVLEFKRTVNDIGSMLYNGNVGTMLYDAVLQGHVKDVALLLGMENIGPSLNQECEWEEWGESQEVVRSGKETPLQFLARKGYETIYDHEPGEDSDEDRVREGYPVIEEMLKKCGCVATGSVDVDVESKSSESDEED